MEEDYNVLYTGWFSKCTKPYWSMLSY